MSIKKKISAFITRPLNRRVRAVLEKQVNAISDEYTERKLRLLLSLVNQDSQPNINALNERLRNIDATSLNIKAMGYRLARSLVDALPPVQHDGPQDIAIKSKLCTQEDMESDWSRYWTSELKVPLILHRKIWEHTYLLQALYSTGNISPDKKGLGFGCGVEPIPSYLAAKGVSTTITDLPPEHQQTSGWMSSNEYEQSLENAYMEHLVERDTFIRMVSHRFVDMNAIPDDLSGYDFCWSICALEHLGSIQKGLDFIENSLRTLRPGGTAVHTMEFNINPDGPTIDNWITVLFQRKHIEEFARKMEVAGHKVAQLDFNAGNRPMDQFIDVPPWGGHLMNNVSEELGISTNQHHLKLAIDGFVATCFAITITKGPE